MYVNTKLFKFMIVFISIWLFSATAYSLQVNYVRTYTAQVEGIKKQSQIKTSNSSSVRQSTDYLDGRARPIQRVTRQGSALSRDVVNKFIYDQFGRQHTDFLPFTMDEKSGDYKTLDSSNDPLIRFYQADNDKISNTLHPFTLTKYDKTPLNRVIEKGAPGERWQPDASNPPHTLRYTYQANRAQDAVLRWFFSDGFLVANSTYATGNLYVTVMTDEHNQRHWDFTDKLDRKILEIKEAENGEKLYTYFVYDDKGNLSYVIPPLTVSKLSSGMSKTINPIEISRECYSYFYDSRNRLISKTLPGSSPISMFYDIWDRLVLTQDGQQRKNKRYSFIKYDAFNRIVMNGELILEGSGEQIRQKISEFYSNAVTDPTIRFERKGDLHGYTNRSFPILTETDKINKVKYFDDYSFFSSLPFSAAFKFHPELNQNRHSERTAGQITGTKTRILSSSEYLFSVIYYDDLYRPIQTISQTHMSFERKTQTYSFRGKLTKSLHTHNFRGKIVTVLKENVYDRAERLIKVYHQINNKEKVLLSNLKYNELDQIVEKNLYSTDDGKNFIQSLDYRYNIRGWLTSINNSSLTDQTHNNDDRNDLFGMDIYYDIEVDDLGNSGNFNGNISAVKWQNTKFNEKHGYTYGYDAYNRINEAKYKNFKFSNKQGAYDVGGSKNNKIEYDANGNILGIKRHSLFSSGRSLIDDLSYIYDGNQLKKVTDESRNSEGFNDIELDEDAYSYDANGNMIKDLNKDITANYNQLNLPELIKKSTGESVKYDYDADGAKLASQIFNANGKLVKSIDYISDIVYENNKIIFIKNDEGRAVPDDKGSGWNYQFFIKDHLGNVRLTFDINRQKTDGTSNVKESLKIIQVDDYYPFGLRIAANHFQDDTVADIKYLYNGKELKDELEINWYDYDARMYDMAIGRWHVSDSKEENYYSYSPYQYSLNNPIRFIDPNGLDPEDANIPKSFDIKEWIDYCKSNGQCDEAKRIVDTYCGGDVSSAGCFIDVYEQLEQQGIPDTFWWSLGGPGGFLIQLLAGNVPSPLDRGPGKLLGPNRGKGGRGGNTEHATVQQSITDTAGGKQEVKIPLGNTGRSRIADNVDSKGRIHQVGDMRKRGGYRPSARERGAIEDIRKEVGSEVDIIFHDKLEKGPTLINPDLYPDWKRAPFFWRKYW